MTLLDDCWEWKGYRDTHGYGQKNGVLLHRLALAWANGPIPTKTLVLHSCDNPPCVNPKHLFLGSHLDNMRDMVAKGRHWLASRTHCVNGHSFEEFSRFTLRADGTKRRWCIQCGRNKGRAAATVRNAAAREAYARRNNESDEENAP